MKIYIWGTGRLVGKVLGKYLSIEKIEGFIDNNESIDEYMGKKVFAPYEMIGKDYDVILVANLYGKQIKDQSKNIGIDISKMIFLYNNCVKIDLNKDYGFVSGVLGERYSKIIKERYHIIRNMETSNSCEEKEISGYEKTDYVRIKTFDLVVGEINKKKVIGEVAEVGVFRGEFAQYINRSFPDKKCYLFDTFSGFDEDESHKEFENGNCTEAFIEAYKQTSLNVVLAKMKYIDNVIIKQGLFPDSLEGLEEKFAFVSIDVDFEESIYSCLNYFYPRLSSGGYLFLHDYNSDLYGVKLAVEKYEKKNDFILCKVPICDANGTLIITK